MLDDLFEVFDNHKQRYGRGHGHDYGHEHDHHDHDNYYENDHGNNIGERFRDGRRYQHRDKRGHYNYQLTIAQIMQNKGLLVALVIGAIMMLIGIVVVIVLFMPVLHRLFSLLEQNGIKGVIDPVVPVLNTLWEGKEALSGK